MSCVSLKASPYGCVKDVCSGNTHEIQKFTWQNNQNVTVEVINFGATITKILVPDMCDKLVDIVQGFENLAGYEHKRNPYHGGTVGRVANRIRDARFVLNGETFNLSPNVKNCSLHGGFIGFNKVIWNPHIEGSRLFLTYLSKDGEEGFPGDLLVTIKMELLDNNEFVIDMSAITTRPTPLNMTNHTYFNLAGHNAGPCELKKHRVTINSNQVTETDDGNIPTGRIKDITNTALDLQAPTAIGLSLNKLECTEDGKFGGFDHNFVIRGYDSTKYNDIIPKFVASVYHISSGRVLEIYSNQPGCQFYTANNFEPEDDDADLMGKNNTKYVKHSSFCLEPQNFPNAVNIPTFPNSILYPGQVYHNCITYKFRVQKY